jgi:hypothetical protein
VGEQAIPEVWLALADEPEQAAGDRRAAAVAQSTVVEETAIADPRLDSGHLGCSPRRRQYRTARGVLLGARGWLTRAAEGIHGLVGGVEEWPPSLPVRPEHLVPGPKYLLVDHQTGCSYPLKTGLNTIGRLQDNDIVLEECTVSRRHCAILVHAWGGCELHDTASRNGTFVNGQPFSRPIRLASGDQIRVCQRLLLLVSQNDHQADVEADNDPGTVLAARNWVPGPCVNDLLSRQTSP